jgi:hypothetical protein
MQHHSCFRVFWTNLRELFVEIGLEDDVMKYIINLYREYNAPLFKQLIRFKIIYFISKDFY